MISKKPSLISGFSAVSLVVALGAAVIIGFGVFFMTRFATPEAGTMQRPAASENLTDRELNTTIPDLISQGQNLECDWKMPTEGSNPFNKGKLWTDGNRGRSMIDTSADGVSMQANALYQNGTAYSWIAIGGQRIGMKFSEASLSEMNNGMTQEERQQAEQIRQNMLFNCQPWNPDETKFILPNDVDFRER